MSSKIYDEFGLNPVVRSVRKPDELAVRITAATISNLRQLRDRGTKVIVMDGENGRAVAVARTLRSLGCQKPYVLEGGFRCGAEAPLRLPLRALLGRGS